MKVQPFCYSLESALCFSVTGTREGELAKALSVMCPCSVFGKFLIRGFQGNKGSTPPGRDAIIGALSAVGS